MTAVRYNISMTLKIYRGLPGSGKSTLARKENRCLILENDMFSYSDGEYAWTPAKVKAAVPLVMSIADQALASGADVVVANTFTKRRHVDAYRKLAERHGAGFEVVRVVGDFGSVHAVPPAVLKSMAEGFEDWPGETVVRMAEGGAK